MPCLHRCICVLVLFTAGCADEGRDDSLVSGSGAFDAGTAESSGSGSPATSAGTNDPGDSGDESTSGASQGETAGDEADSADDGADTGAPEGTPDCSQYWIGTYIPSAMYMEMNKVPETAAEMFCHVNMERINYSFHTRNNGCVWDHNDPQLSWPYEMEYDADLAQAAQAEADAIAAGGAPKGQAGKDGIQFFFYVDGCGTAEYTVSSIDDGYEQWPRVADSYWPDSPAALTKANGNARMGIFYYDSGPGTPTLTKLGVGLSLNGDRRNWVLKFGQ